MKTKILWLISCMIVLGACSDSEYSLDKLVPKEYHKILYVKNSGKQDIILYDTDDDNVYTLSVIKAGSNPDLAACATVHVLTQEELNDKYAIPEGINYKLINRESYLLESTQLNFASSEHYKNVNIALKPQLVKTAMESDPAAVWVLPLLLTSETDSISIEKDEMFLIIKDVVTPTFGFTNVETELLQYEYGSVPSISPKIKLNLDADNKWDLECSFAVDENYMLEYNKVYGTNFRLLPEASYTIPQTMLLPSGKSSTDMEINIKGEDIQPGDYMLPIRITEVSLFELSEGKSICPLKIRIMGHKLNRSGWTAEGSSEELSGEGAVNGRAGCVLDDNLGTFWHSQWQGDRGWPPYELVIDAKKAYTFSQLAMIQRGGGYTDTGSGKFYISADKENWTEVGRFSMEKVTDVQTFSINPSNGRFVKIRIESSLRDGYCSLSEVYFYGSE